MAKVCPMKGCKEKEGMCIHDKMMIGIMLIIVALLVYKLFV